MTVVRYATPADLVVFVDWFAARLPGAVESGDAHKAGQIARGIAHFARQLPPPFFAIAASQGNLTESTIVPTPQESREDAPGAI